MEHYDLNVAFVLSLERLEEMTLAASGNPLNENISMSRNKLSIYAILHLIVSLFVGLVIVIIFRKLPFDFVC
ncbi:hypothetical protein HMPREF1650_10715 [Corynebacterium freneyi DNF00450]|uniref:Uncharacterized protein n=1 Tax=Corynebacterium freneyi DNF00450 TaxID=1287475 RepID=A0A095XZC7_9CORY|nr:hypothetical protein HMPREF1650_10715 [Corynebacterium freneyi DNF00450]